MGTELNQTRLAALHQAAHDLKGNATAEEVVKRAEVYLKFLQGRDAPEFDALERFRYWRPVDMTNDQFVEHLRAVFPLATEERLQELAITIGPGASFTTTTPCDMAGIGA